MKGGLLFGIFLAVSISACSSGDSGSSNSSPPPPATSAEGLWTGNVGNGRSMAGLVLNDGTYWFLYFVGNPAVIAGVVQGNGTSNAGAFTSSNGKDFNLEGLGILDMTVAGSYVQKQSLSGTVTYLLGGQTTFTSTYDTAYDLTPNVSLLLGTYTGSTAISGGVEAVTVTLSAPNTLTGLSASGCSFTGGISPRTQGNAYDVTVTFAGGVCSNGTSTVTGVAFFNATTKTLYSAALNPARTNGFLYVGTKP